MIIAGAWWYLARSSGLIAAVLLVAAFVWGILLATRLLKPVKSKPWLLDLHRWLAGLAVVFVALHLVGLVADSYVQFNLSSILIPFASEWRPVAVTWGVVALYLMVAIQLTSWRRIRSRLSRTTWHAIHLLSFPLLWLIAVHAGAAGTDVGNRWYLISLFALVGVMVFVVLYRILAGTGRQARPKPQPSNHAAKSAGYERPVASGRR